MPPGLVPPWAKAALSADSGGTIHLENCRQLLESVRLLSTVFVGFVAGTARRTDRGGRAVLH